MTMQPADTGAESVHEPNDWFEHFWRESPEPKLELIDGRLVVGNSLVGSRYLLWWLLHDLGPQAALPMAPLERWWEALAFQAPPLLASARAWEAWAAQVAHVPRIAPAGPCFDAAHYAAFCQLMVELYQAVDTGGLGRVIQRDFVMRSGENGLTPDFLLIGPERLNRLHEYYLDGPADVVIEILLPGHEAQDAVVKRRIYAAGGVPEYWIVDPMTQTIDFLRLIDGDYQAQVLDANGRYRPASLPALACVPARLWAYLSNPKDRRSSLWSGAFEVDPSAHLGKPRARSDDTDAYGWDRPPFAPQLSLRPTPISFEQYIAWCPEAKFERIDGRPLIGGWLGTRNVLGLLLMTFGLEAAMTVLHPSMWIAGMLAEEEARRHDAGRRDAWWARAREAAELLRTQAAVQRVAVIGDLVRAAPLHYWSELTLVVWHLPKPNHDVLHALYDRINEARIDVVEAERATRTQQQAIANEAVDL